MLVLTRRSKDKISFPQVGITIHFVRVQSGHVKVGIDAPKDIAIIRDEIASANDAASIVRKQLLRLPREIRHGIRNELHQISVGMHLYKELVDAGMQDEANETFSSVQACLNRLDQNEILKKPEDSKPATMAGSIVLIEDVANEREMLASFLRIRGYHVVSFENGQDAIDYLDDHNSPSVVLVDMKMPKCDGPTTIKRIRSNERLGQTQVFAVSGTSPEENGVVTGKAGVDRWFPKPLNPTFLIDAIDRVVGQNESVAV